MKTDGYLFKKIPIYCDFGVDKLKNYLNLKYTRI